MKTTATSKIVHRQKLRIGPYVKLDAPFVSEESARLSYHVSETELLFPGRAFEDTEQLAYCTLGDAADFRNAPSRACFVDPNGDGKFSLAYAAPRLKDDSGSPFKRADLTRASKRVVDPPLTYSPAQSDLNNEMEMAIRFEPGDKGKPQLVVIYMSGAFEEEVGRDAVEIPAGRTFPFSLDVRGAKILIVGLADGVLSYRMMAGFPDGAYTVDFNAPNAAQ